HVTLRRCEEAGHFFQVGDQRSSRLLARGRIRSPKHGRWMRGGIDGVGKRRTKPPAATLGDAKVLSKERLRRGRAEAHNDLWLNKRELLVEPRPTRPDFCVVWF